MVDDDDDDDDDIQCFTVLLSMKADTRFTSVHFVLTLLAHASSCIAVVFVLNIQLPTAGFDPVISRSAVTHDTTGPLQPAVVAS